MRNTKLLLVLSLISLFVSCSTEKSALNYGRFQALQTSNLRLGKQPVPLPGKIDRINSASISKLERIGKLILPGQQHFTHRKKTSVSRDSCDYILLKTGL